MKYSLGQLQEIMRENGGNLDLSGTDVTSLPEGLTVDGDLDLSDTEITSLPEGLSVGRDLELFYSKITSLPDDLTVGRDLYLNGTPIKALPKKMDVGGSILLFNSAILSLPDRLTVHGDLNLSKTPLLYLPEKLTYMETFTFSTPMSDSSPLISTWTAEFTDQKQGETMVKWLVDLRGDRTQQEIANAVGIAQSTYASYETGSRTPSVPTAKRIAATLGFDWTRFYEDAGQLNPTVPPPPATQPQAPAGT